MSEIAKSYGVKLQFFLVGSALEDPDIDYLKQLVDDGHAIDNHTYTHVNVKAKTIDGLQEVYANAPWRAAGLSPLEVIRREVRQTNEAIEEKLGERPRVPDAGRFAGGARNGCRRQDVPRTKAFRLPGQLTLSRRPPERHQPGELERVSAPSNSRNLSLSQRLLEIPLRDHASCLPAHGPGPLD